MASSILFSFLLVNWGTEYGVANNRRPNDINFSYGNWYHLRVCCFRARYSLSPSWNSKNQIKKGNQIFWVCPLIEESKKVDHQSSIERYKYLNNYFENNVGLLHGLLSKEEKNKIIKKLTKRYFNLLLKKMVAGKKNKVTKIKLKEKIPIWDSICKLSCDQEKL